MGDPATSAPHAGSTPETSQQAASHESQNAGPDVGPPSGPSVNVPSISSTSPAQGPIAIENNFSTIPIFHVRSPSNAPSPSSAPSTTYNSSRPSSSRGRNRFEVASSISTSSSVEDFASLAAVTAPIPVNSNAPLRANLSTMSFTSTHSVSPGSVISSPALAAMTDITPLPSPLLPDDSPNPWKSKTNRRSGSVGSLKSVTENVKSEDFAIGVPTTPQTRSRSSSKKKVALSGLGVATADAASNVGGRARDSGCHSRHRSLSEQVIESVHNIRPRNTTVSSGTPAELASKLENPLHREAYLAEQRGLVCNSASQRHSIPTPPPSNRSTTESEGDEPSIGLVSAAVQSSNDKPSSKRYLVVNDASKNMKMTYQVVRPLGQGTFSKVVLATSEALPPSFGPVNETSEPRLDKKQLVAIKIVDHGPAGGADEERVELSLKREVEFMQDVQHPSLIHLMAFDVTGNSPDGHALLVLNYCAGGDLFDLASGHRELFNSPALAQRIFSELASAVGYLHERWIVHRDIKLENVLVNIPPLELSSITDIQNHPQPIVTLTDLGLSRKIPEPPLPPMLTTRCGSEDYAAPEILLSQPYDGRATDAWALGVLLYALMEGRLPFDPPPPRPGARVQRGRSRAAHRIARCDWIWSRFGDADGDWDASETANQANQANQAWEGARDVVDGLLRKVTRGRWPMDKVLSFPWVLKGVNVEDGLRRYWEDEVVMAG